MKALDDKSFDLIFRHARTRNGWQDKPVPEELLRQIYDVAVMGPTSANCQPQRIVFVTTPEAKEKLRPALSNGNMVKTMKAPVTAIFAYDMQFYDLLTRTFPHSPDARSWFAGNPNVIKETAFRNATLQAAYS